MHQVQEVRRTDDRNKVTNHDNLIHKNNLINVNLITNNQKLKNNNNNSSSNNNNSDKNTNYFNNILNEGNNNILSMLKHKAHEKSKKFEFNSLFKEKNNLIDNSSKNINEKVLTNLKSGKMKSSSKNNSSYELTNSKLKISLGDKDEKNIFNLKLNEINKEEEIDDDAETERKTFDPNIDLLANYFKKQKEQNEKANNEESLKNQIFIGSQVGFSNSVLSITNSNFNLQETKLKFKAVNTLKVNDSGLLRINSNNDEAYQNDKLEKNEFDLSPVKKLNSKKLQSTSSPPKITLSSLLNRNLNAVVDIAKTKSGSSLHCPKITIEENKNYIIVIDDVSFVRNSIRKNLETIFLENKSPYKVITGSDGVDLLWYIVDDQRNGNRIKCVITDESMEFMNGSFAVSLLKGINEEGKIPELPILICSTGYSDDQMLSSLINCGFNEVIDKNPKKTILQSTLKKYDLI